MKETSIHQEEHELLSAEPAKGNGFDLNVMPQQHKQTGQSREIQRRYLCFRLYSMDRGSTLGTEGLEYRFSSLLTKQAFA